MADTQPATPKKRLPFKRTVARRQQSDLDAATQAKAEDDNDLELFRHSKEVFNAVIQEAEEELRKSATPENHAGKRRKVSQNESPTKLGSSPLRRSATLDGSDDDLVVNGKGKGKDIVRPSRTATPESRTPRRTSSSMARSSSLAATVIADSSDDSSDQDYNKPTAHRIRRRKSSSHNLTPGRRLRKRKDDDDDDHDDDFLIEIPPPAAEISKAKPSENNNKNNSNSDSDLEEITPPEDSVPDEFSEWVAKAREIQQEKSKLAAVVNCFVTSQLDGAGPPVAVRRRLNQVVGIALDVWVERQRAAGVVVPDELARRLFLTWKGNKIYGQSTIAALGVQVDAQGQLRAAEGEGYTRGGIHLEVWHEEAYQEWLARRRRERAFRLGALDGDDESDGLGGVAGAGPEVVVAQEQKKKGVKVVLKARDYEALKLTAKEDSSIETLAEAFRTQRQIGPELDIAIYFDGERLEEDSLVRDADIDIDDVNQFEVHIKKRGG